jgi:hypothetical protein
MSFEALNLVSSRTTGSSSRKVVLLVLASYADEQWSCYPSQETIAARSELSPRTVRSVLSDLEAEGIVHRTPRRTEGGYRTSDRLYLDRAALERLPAIVASRSHPPANPARLPANPARLPATDGHSHRQPLPGNSKGNHQGEPSVGSIEHPSVVLTVVGPNEYGVAEDAFDHWYREYPKKAEKEAARRAYAKALKKTTPLALLEGLERYKDSREVKDGYIKNPATWLNKGCWEDEPAPVPPRARPKGFDTIEQTFAALRGEGA